MINQRMDILEIITEEMERLNLIPNLTRNTGIEKGLVYLSSSKSYASAYANGYTSNAHSFKGNIVDGVLFYVCMDNIWQHYGGDVWVRGYKDEIVSDLENYGNTNELSDLTNDFLQRCGIEDINQNMINKILPDLKKNDISIISPIDWSNIQDEYSGYNEIALKQLDQKNIIKVEVYQDGKIIKTIVGNVSGCENIFYHGSPLKYWGDLLK